MSDTKGTLQNWVGRLDRKTGISACCWPSCWPCCWTCSCCPCRLALPPSNSYFCAWQSASRSWRVPLASTLLVQPRAPRGNPSWALFVLKSYVTSPHAKHAQASLTASKRHTEIQDTHSTSRASPHSGVHTTAHTLDYPNVRAEEWQSEWGEKKP